MDICTSVHVSVCVCAVCVCGGGRGWVHSVRFWPCSQDCDKRDTLPKLYKLQAHVCIDSRYLCGTGKPLAVALSIFAPLVTVRIQAALRLS